MYTIQWMCEPALVRWVYFFNALIDWTAVIFTGIDPFFQWRCGSWEQLSDTTTWFSSFFFNISMIHPSTYIDNTARFLLPSQAAWTLLYLSNLQRGCIYTWIRCSHWSYLFPSRLIKTFTMVFFSHMWDGWAIALCVDGGPIRQGHKS